MLLISRFIFFIYAIDARSFDDIDFLFASIIFVFFDYFDFISLISYAAFFFFLPLSFSA